MSGSESFPVAAVGIGDAAEGDISGNTFPKNSLSTDSEKDKGPGIIHGEEPATRVEERLAATRSML